MDNESTDVLSIKLDILIKDFQRFRREQEKINKELTAHFSDDERVQSKLLTTQRWHTVIGGSFISSMIYYLSKHWN